MCRHPHALLCSSSWYFTLDYFQDSLLAPLTPASLHPTCYLLPASGIAFIKQRSDYVATLPKTLRFHVCRIVSALSSSQPDQLYRLIHTKAIPCTHTSPPPNHSSPLAVSGACSHPFTPLVLVQVWSTCPLPWPLLSLFVWNNSIYILKGTVGIFPSLGRLFSTASHPLRMRCPLWPTLPCLHGARLSFTCWPDESSSVNSCFSVSTPTMLGTKWCPRRFWWPPLSGALLSFSV